MKYILFFILLYSVKVKSQDYKSFGNRMWYSASSVVIDTTELKKGDTLFLGFGSGINKRFVFIQFRNGLLMASGTLEGLTPAYSNGYMVITEIKVRRAFGKEYPDVLLHLNGDRNKAFCDFYNAIQSGEIVRTTGTKKVL